MGSTIGRAKKDGGSLTSGLNTGPILVEAKF